MRLTRRSSPDPEPGPELGFVFVVTYGRSGSTLVQGVLNSLPGYLVRGENRGAVHHLWHFHRTCATEAARVRRGSGARSPAHPWFGIGGFPSATAHADTRRLVLDTLLRPEPGTRVTGFKEIRWFEDDALDYVDWLREVFPGARFVVNTRDHAQVARSGWWAADPDALTTLATMESRLDILTAHLGEAAHRVHYDDYAADPAVLRGLVEWLGETWDPEAVAEVFAVRHAARRSATPTADWAG